MRFRRKSHKIMEGDLTPMIDMTFQLIAFFMLLINFTEVEKSEELELPDSVLAKPPAEPPDYKIILNLDDNGIVTFAGKTFDSFEDLGPDLRFEREVARREGVSPGEISVIIRADRGIETGRVQDLIVECQSEELESFSLRVNNRVQ